MYAGIFIRNKKFSHSIERLEAKATVRQSPAEDRFVRRIRKYSSAAANLQFANTIAWIIEEHFVAGGTNLCKCDDLQDDGRGYC